MKEQRGGIEIRNDSADELEVIGMLGIMNEGEQRV
jgi:hypothetical protein